MKNRQFCIAITGANGFVARNFRKILHEENIQAICIARRNFSSYKSETKIISEKPRYNAICIARNVTEPLYAKKPFSILSKSFVE